jgi:hypothetical protein
MSGKRAAALGVAAAVAATTLVGNPAYAAPSQPGLVEDALPNPCLAGLFNGCVDATGGLNARVHHGTGPVSFNDTVLYTYPYGTQVHVYCYLTGPAVTGPAGTTTIWDAIDVFRVPGGTTSAWDAGAFIVSSDAWIFTGSDNPIVPHC